MNSEFLLQAFTRSIHVSSPITDSFFAFVPTSSYPVRFPARCNFLQRVEIDRGRAAREAIDVEFHFYYIVIRISWFKSFESSSNISLHLSPLNSFKIRIEDTTIGATYNHNEH